MGSVKTIETRLRTERDASQETLNQGQEEEGLLLLRREGIKGKESRAQVF